MAQQDKLTYEGTFNHASTGLFKDNTAGEIEAIDHRAQVTNTKDSVPFTLDDSYTWPFPQVTAAGTDTYTATLSPPITAYAAGQKFQILFTNANTGASTLALNGLAALAVTKNGATALVAGDIPVGSIKILSYDGTRLQIIGDGGGAGGSGTLESVTGNGVDNTDPDNPVITDVNAAVALTDAGTIDITAIKHTLTTSSSRTFTISYTGDDGTIEITLNATSATQTFPAGSLCVTEGAASGDNTCPMSGVSGDKYIIATKKIGSVYYVVCKNFGQ